MLFARDGGKFESWCSSFLRVQRMTSLIWVTRRCVLFRVGEFSGLHSRMTEVSV